MSEGERIRACRKLVGLTQQQAAILLGISASTLSNWENGKAIRHDVSRTILQTQPSYMAHS
jgi:transcriptional regulator with XRE-family HTH domain